jgi:hypothetical protein
MARSNYRKSRGRKSRGRKTMRNKKHIKKQYGGSISDDCISEIITEALRQNENLTEEQISIIVNKLMSVSTLWRSYPDLMALLEQIGGIVEDNLNYDEFLDWANNTVTQLIRTENIN